MKSTQKVFRLFMLFFCLKKVKTQMHFYLFTGMMELKILKVILKLENRISLSLYWV
jgi:hypothetical protein